MCSASGVVVGAQRLTARRHLGDAPFDALEENSFVNLELDHRVEIELLLVQHAVERLGLRHGARKAVEDEAVVGVGLGDAVGDDRHNDVVGYEFAARHDLLGVQPDRGAGGSRGTQHVTGGELNDSVFFDESWACVPFPAPGGPSRISLIYVSPSISIS